MRDFGCARETERLPERQHRLDGWNDEYWCDLHAGNVGARGARGLEKWNGDLAELSDFDLILLSRCGMTNVATAIGEVVDVAVIGSGFGGAAVACRLAQAGRKVAVLEQGKEYPAGRGEIDQT